MAFWPPFGAGIFTRPRTSLRWSKESWAVGRGRRSSIWPNRGYGRIRDRPDSSSEAVRDLARYPTQYTTPPGEITKWRGTVALPSRRFFSRAHPFERRTGEFV
jgi:hypothetical protein